MERNIRQLLWDIEECINDIETFIEGCSFENYDTDRMLQAAVERKLEIMGEALNRLQRIDEEDIEVKIPEYRQVIGLRNIIAHGYDIVENSIIWNVLTNELPTLKDEVQNYL